ncbi:hypothetical protein [Curtobacterium sp. MWU13-2055]|uniref:hypothetical protein n=1 Tax=Curtobacterium sp. MWU13-2055 TaxID=2931928 RepID=UPI00200C0079|nr:hypothetical protein [Curtobacterium sp. MWU13-2055]
MIEVQTARRLQAWENWDEGAWGAFANRSDPPLLTALEALRSESAPAARARQFRPVRGVRHLDFIRQTDAEKTTVRAWFSSDGRTTYSRDLMEIAVEDFVLGHPTRDYSRRKSQRHKPVAVWTHTTHGHVHCESRLEREFVLLADFDPRVAHISAQPFTALWPNGFPLKKHTPDFGVLSPGLPAIAVDVKTPAAAAKPANIARHALIRETLAAAGIIHIVWTGLPESVTRNLSSFSKARPDSDLALTYGLELLRYWHPKITVQELVRNAAQFGALDRPLALQVVRHLLWTGALRTDLHNPYTSASVLEKP